MDLLYLFEEFPDKSTGTTADYYNNNESNNTKRTSSSTVVIVVLSWRHKGLLREKKNVKEMHVVIKKGK